MKFHISPLTYLFYAFMLLICHNLAVIAALSAVLVHEAAHLLAIAICGCSLESIDATPLGLIIRRTGITGHVQDIAIHAAGPIANLLLVCIWTRTIGSNSLPVAANLFFGLLNLLPIQSLDGGKALSALLAYKLDESTCSRIGRWVSNSALFILWLIASAELLMLDGSPSLLFFCIGLFMEEINSV